MATKKILFFMKIPEKGKKLSTPRMLKMYHRETPLSMSFSELTTTATALLTIISIKNIYLRYRCQFFQYFERFTALFFKEL